MVQYIFYLVQYKLWYSTRRRALTLSVCDLHRRFSSQSVGMVATCGTPASVYCYTLMKFVFAPSVSSLQLLLDVCERELDRLDMTINVKKSSCICIGPRFDAHCCCITTRNGGEVLWGNTLRYLGVHITAGGKFSCSLLNVKRSFCRAFNCIFSKVGRIAYENVVIELRAGFRGGAQGAQGPRPPTKRGPPTKPFNCYFALTIG